VLCKYYLNKNQTKSRYSVGSSLISQLASQMSLLFSSTSRNKYY